MTAHAMPIKSEIKPTKKCAKSLASVNVGCAPLVIPQLVCFEIDAYIVPTYSTRFFGCKSPPFLCNVC